MKNTLKKIGIFFVGATVLAAGVETMDKEPLDRKLPPAGSEFELDNGKYVPIRVEGYETKADYPDEYWLKQSEFDEVKSHYRLKQ